MRARAEHRIADRRARAARIWRRRTDDFVASARRRDHSAARARPLSGLSRGESRSVPARSVRSPAATSRRLSVGDRSFSSTCRSGSPPFSLCCGCRRGRRIAGGPRSMRRAWCCLRCSSARSFLLWNRPSAWKRATLPMIFGAGGIWNSRVACADLAGKAVELAAHSARSCSESHRSGAPTAWPPATALRWCR